MQVDSERLFTNKCIIMGKESDNFQNGLFRGQYLVIKAHKGQQRHNS